MLSRVALVRTDVTEKYGASFIRVTRIGEVGTTQAATSNRRNLKSYVRGLNYISKGMDNHLQIRIKSKSK
jgi:hypothetical protein